MEKCRIIIAYDPVVIHILMTGILEKDKDIAEVVSAKSVADAATILSNERFYVVILDIEMPVMSGLDYLVTLHRREIPVVMLSGRMAEGSDMRAIALLRGASACFNKANAVKDAALLVRLVKAAANHRVRLGSVDVAALTHAKATYLVQCQ